MPLFQISSHTAVFNFLTPSRCWQITCLPIAAARPLICHGPLYTASLMLLRQVPESRP
ncbi:unnamed protein product [Staurois parvus]|uniref:Uncharacterized protein n=1 Tax=Staurois parvus TaxID=386267 RepID=A0ABN9E2K7_9NEOB|nr:unnamed protein product [Staurois parvus]